MSTITQALAYKGILKIQQALYWIGTLLPDNIWKSLQSKTLSKEIRNFLWKCMYNIYKLRKYWKNIQDYEDRAKCLKCRVEKSMDHILTECEASGQGLIWNFVALVYRKRNLTLTKPSLGDILGCTIAGRDNNKNTRKRRFEAIVMLEATYMIWKARCK